ncbi:leucine-rich repeat domain-containing protein [Fibrella aquatica]|uniref:leucine-rich repeat domain-containing protein n=1 Tax=Fibrella aquatica TaxID=3242487 RepID=UPI003522169F
MQGYRGSNRLFFVIVSWLICFSSGASAQQSDIFMPVYSPKSGNSFVSAPRLTNYTTFSDLAGKLASQKNEAYRLYAEFSTKEPIDWEALRTIPPATYLSIHLLDSVNIDPLLPILATWPTLKTIMISGVANGPNSFTTLRNAKGEIISTSRVNVYKPFPMKGWEKLQSVEEVLIYDELELGQVCTALATMPRLTTLTIHQALNRKELPLTPKLSALRGLQKLTITGWVMFQNYADAFRGLTNLRELIITDADCNDLTAGLNVLPALQSLHVTASSIDRLRLGKLPRLETLHLNGQPFVQAPRSFTASNNTSPSVVSLDSTFLGLTSLKKVSFEKVKLAAFPASLLANAGLMFLSIPDADLKALPADLDKLVALEELILDKNSLHQLPDALGKLSRLTRLSASKCELTSLPASIGQLTSLTSLSVDTNQLTALPASVGQLTALKQLNVSLNQLTSLAGELGTLPNLKIIAAFGNSIGRFPVHLIHVQDLYLSNNQLTTLPGSIGVMKHLRQLFIDENPITALPNEIEQLDSLRTLVLGGNQLTTLPSSIGSLRGLVQLTVGKNQLREVPETIGRLTKLTALGLSDNPIVRLPGSLGNLSNLTQLGLKLPQLEAIPETVGQCSALNYLYVESDMMLTIPTEVTNCSQLKMLSLTGSRFIGLPESIGQLTKLNTITLDGGTRAGLTQGQGRVVALPASLVKCSELETLTVRNQQQFDGLDGLQLAAGLPNLKQLTFSNCGITGLEGGFWKNLKVVALDLTKNRFSEIPAAILEMPNLNFVHFSENYLPMELNRSFYFKTDLARLLKK